MTLNQNSEVIALEAAGLSAHQVLAPLFLVAAVTALLTFGFTERVVTRSTATLKAWQAVDYRPIPRDSAVKANVGLSRTARHCPVRPGGAQGRGAAMRIERCRLVSARSGQDSVVEVVRAPSATRCQPRLAL